MCAIYIIRERPKSKNIEPDRDEQKCLIQGKSYPPGTKETVVQARRDTGNLSYTGTDVKKELRVNTQKNMTPRTVASDKAGYGSASGPPDTGTAIEIQGKNNKEGNKTTVPGSSDETVVIEGPKHGVEPVDKEPDAVNDSTKQNIGISDTAFPRQKKDETLGPQTSVSGARKHNGQANEPSNLRKAEEASESREEGQKLPVDERGNTSKGAVQLPRYTTSVQKGQDSHEAYTSDSLREVNCIAQSSKPQHDKRSQGSPPEDHSAPKQPNTKSERAASRELKPMLTRNVFRSSVVIPGNTAENCERLHSLMSLPKPMSIDMVLTRDREEHMNLYMARDIGKSREDIAGTLQSVLPSFYKRILGHKQDGLLLSLNMLKTRRFLADSSSSRLELTSLKVVPDIIIIETNGKTVHESMNSYLLGVKDKLILIAGARQNPGDLRPADVICVGVLSKTSGQWCAYGDKPYFIVYTDYYEHKLYLETKEQPDAHEVATLYTALVASLVTMSANQNGWNITERMKLKSTNVMREILRKMCSHPDQMIDGEGYGILDPWPFLLEWDKMRAVLDAVVKENF